ncbi:MAG: hypothetical protein GX323_03850 [Clostridiales bacterium]|nr:hypothetical protein [Clostridiales bacterium]
MDNRPKVAKFRKRRSINIGHIVFIFIVIYIAISFYIYLTKDHLTIYEVRRGSIAKETVYNGLILRNEEVYNTNRAGYVYYYYKDGDRVPRNSVVYSIDENESSTALVSDDLNNTTLKSEEIAKIKKEIKDFRNNYSNANFISVYDFKYDLNNVSLEIKNEQKHDSLKGYEVSNRDYVEVVNSNKSGIITYTLDNYEKLTDNDITYDHFKGENYSKTLLRKDEIYQAGTPVYKLVTDNSWDIIIPLSKETYEYLSSQDEEDIRRVTIKFLNEKLESPGNFTYYQKGDEYFGKITLDSYMEKFINQRFVEIELKIDEKSGLKIPTSSIVDKEFYLIPHEYFTKGGDSNEQGLVLESYDEENELVLTFVPTEIFYEDENFCYVNTLLFEQNSWIQSVTGQRLKLNEKATLKGVYNVNKGYAVFRRIEIVEEGKEYTVVKEGTSYGLSVYDQIALVGDTAIEQQIIY